MSYHVPPAPFATFSSSQTQSVASPPSAQAITYDTTESAQGISLSGGSRIVLPQPGNYCLTFSAIGHNSGSANAKWLNIFLKKNGVTLDRSSTIVNVSKDMVTTVVATFNVNAAAAGDFYELFLAGEDTATQILATAAQAAVPSVSPAMPACPSIVVAAWQID